MIISLSSNCLVRNSLIFVVISALVVASIYGLYSRSDLAAAPPNYTRGPIECETMYVNTKYVCCQTETDTKTKLEIRWCTVCDNTKPPSNCSERYNSYYREEPPTLPEPGPKLPRGNLLPGNEVLQQLQQTQQQQPPPGPRLPLENAIPDEKVLQQPATTPEADEGGPTPPPCPDKPPIPPDCTLKPPLLQPGEVTPEVAPPTAPEADEGTQSRIPTSPTGSCVPFIRTSCIPCDPGLPGANCVPESEWPPVQTTDTGSPEGGKSPILPPTGKLEETTPQVAPSTVPEAEEEKGTQPGIDELCPKGQVLDDKTGLCVLEVPQAVEQSLQPQEEQQLQQSGEGDSSGDNQQPDEQQSQQPEEEQQLQQPEEGDSSGDNNN